MSTKKTNKAVRNARLPLGHGCGRGPVPRQETVRFANGVRLVLNPRAGTVRNGDGRG